MKESLTYKLAHATNFLSNNSNRYEYDNEKRMREREREMGKKERGT